MKEEELDSAPRLEPIQRLDGSNLEPEHGKDDGSTSISPRQRTASVSSDDSDSEEGDHAQFDPMQSSIHSIYQISNSMNALADFPSSYFGEETSKNCEVSVENDENAPTKQLDEDQSRKREISPPISSSLTESSLRALDRANSRQQHNPPANLGPYKSQSSSRSGKEPLRQNIDKGKGKVKEQADQIPSNQEELAARLQDVFGLEKSEEVLAECEASLFRSVMLEGYMYLTTCHLCFYAYLRTKETSILRSGYMGKRSRRTRLFTRHWFILSPDSLSWYSSPNNPYFANGDISLQYVTAVQPSTKNQKALKIMTASRQIYLDADSTAARDEWIRIIQKAVFRCQTESDSIKITIKLNAVTEARKAPLQFVDALCVKVQDSDFNNTSEEYFFAYMPQLDSTLKLLRSLIKAASRFPADADANHDPADTGDKLQGSQYTRVSRRASTETITRPRLEFDSEVRYPPQSSDASLGDSVPTRNASWQLNMPGWVKNAPRALSSGRLAFSRQSSQNKTITQVLSSHTAKEEPSHSSGAPTNAAEEFRSVFTVRPDERLLFHTTAYMHRGLPVYGKIFISNLFVRFLSTTLLLQTKMTLPVEAITVTMRNRSLRLGYHGLILVVRAFEEIFIEFGSEQERNSMQSLVDFQGNHIRRARNEGFTPSPTDATSNLRRLSSPKSPKAYIDEEIGDSALLVDFTPSKSLHFVCLTIGSRGDVQPYIALCRGLLNKGHRCTIASHPEYRTWVESYGITFAEVGGDPAELMRICVENGTFTLAFLREGLSKFRGWLDDLLASAWDACQGADVLIESPSAMAGLHIAEALRIPYFRAFTMPWSRTRAYPHAFAVPDSKLGGQYNQLSYIMFDNVFWRAISGQINAWRKQTLKLPATSLDKLNQDKAPFLYNLSPSVMPRPLDWPEWIHVTGYWFLDGPPTSWQPPSKLLEFLKAARSGGKKLLYIGFGSIVVSDPNHLTQIIYDAVLKSGVHAIVSKGWSNRLRSSLPTHGIEYEELSDALKSAIYQVDSIPHDWLFPQLDAVCHHGGSGTTGASLRAGKPTIIKPFFGDQFFQADRVESLGAGIHVRETSSDHLAAAFKKACNDPRLVYNANALGVAIRKENGVENAIETLYRDMEYARVLMKGADPEDFQESPTSRRGRSLSVTTAEGNETETSSSWDQMSANTTFDDVLSRSGLGTTPPASEPGSRGSDAGSRNVSRSQSHSRMSSQNSPTASWTARLCD